MDILNKILKNKTVMTLSLIAGISGLVNIYAMSTIGSWISDAVFYGDSSVEGVLLLSLISFWIALLLCIAGTIMSGYRLIRKKDKSVMNLLMLDLNIAGALFSLLIIKPYNVISEPFFNNYSAIMDLYSIAMDITLWRIKFIVYGLLSVAMITAYFYGKKKHSEWIEENLADDLPDGMPKIPMDPAKKKKIVMISGVAVIVLLVLWGASAAISAFDRTEVDLMTNCELNIQEGSYSGAGEAAAACVPTYETEDMKRRSAIESLISRTSYDIEPSKDLSNGDKVKVRATYDEELAKENKLKVKADPIELTVSGLDEVYTSAGQVPQNVLDTLEQKAEEGVREEAPRLYYTLTNTDKTITGMNKIGEFCKFRNTYAGAGLDFYYVYEVDLHVVYYDGDTADKTMYVCAEISRITPDTNMTYVGPGNNVTVYEIYQDSASSALNSVVAKLGEDYEDLMNQK